jgi:hypothetical protein
MKFSILCIVALFHLTEAAPAVTQSSEERLERRDSVQKCRPKGGYAQGPKNGGGDSGGGDTDGGVTGGGDSGGGYTGGGDTDGGDTDGGDTDGGDTGGGDTGGGDTGGGDTGGGDTDGGDTGGGDSTGGGDATTQSSSITDQAESSTNSASSEPTPSPTADQSEPSASSASSEPAPSPTDTGGVDAGGGDTGGGDTGGGDTGGGDTGGGDTGGGDTGGGDTGGGDNGGVDDADTFLGAHNICRGEALGDDFTPLTWDSDLVTAATAYAQTLVDDDCATGHAETSSGENLYYFGAGVIPDGVNIEASSVALWCSEPLVKEDGGAEYNHHTQIAWAQTPWDEPVSFRFHSGIPTIGYA